MSYGGDDREDNPQILILDEGEERQERHQRNHSHGRALAQMNYGGTKIMNIDETNREYLSQEVGDEGSS